MPTAFLYRFILLLAGFSLIATNAAWSQPKAKKNRILFLLDASSSMTLPWSGQNNRFDVASNILLNIVDSIYAINNEVEFAVRCYGTTYPAQLKNCTDTRLEVPFNIQNANQIKTRLRNIQALGFSPIAYSLMQASLNELSLDATYDYSIILINDGGESCGGNVCETFQRFLQNRIKITPYIIGLDQNEQLKTYYACIGNYLPVMKPDDIPVAIQTIVDAHRPILDKPKSLNLKTQFSNTPMVKDSAQVVPMVSPPIVRPTEIIPGYLFLMPYPRKTGQRVVLKAVSSDYPRSKVIISWPLDEPKPKPQPAVARVTEVIPVLKMIARVSVPITKPQPEARFRKAPAIPVVRFGFASEQPRDSQVFRRLLAVGYVKQKTSGFAMKGKAFKPARREKVIVRYEPEVKRDTTVYPPLRMAAFPIRKSTGAWSKASAKKTKREKVLIRFEAPEKLPELKAMLNLPYPKRVSYAYALPKSAPIKLRREKVYIRIEGLAAAKPPKKDTLAAKPPRKALPGDVEFKVKTETAMETQVQVFFEGPNGKTYPKYKPMIQVIDRATKTPVDTFKRDMKGESPLAQPAREGNYDFVVLGSNNIYANNVRLEANQLNKVYIKVHEGSLYFTYMGDRAKVVPYKAVVNRRFAEGATIYQNCSDVFYYEPGTYYVEITTVPVTKHVVYMDFEAQYEIQVAQPGSLQITASDARGKVMLQQPLGDDFATFLTTNVSGNPEEQRFEMQPGSYRIIYPVDPKFPDRGTKTKLFRVDSNRETLLDLD